MLKSIAAVLGECTTKCVNTASYNIVYIVPDLSSFDHDWKMIKKQVVKSKVYVHKKWWTDKKLFALRIFHEFPSVLWKNNVRSVLFSNENKKPNHCFQIFSVAKFLRTVWTGLSLRPVHGNCQFFSEFTFTDYISTETLILSLIRVN